MKYSLKSLSIHSSPPPPNNKQAVKISKYLIYKENYEFKKGLESKTLNPKGKVQYKILAAAEQLNISMSLLKPTHVK